MKTHVPPFTSPLLQIADIDKVVIVVTVAASNIIRHAKPVIVIIYYSIESINI